MNAQVSATIPDEGSYPQATATPPFLWLVKRARLNPNIGERFDRPRRADPCAVVVAPSNGTAANWGHPVCAEPGFALFGDHPGPIVLRANAQPEDLGILFARRSTTLAGIAQAILGDGGALPSCFGNKTSHARARANACSDLGMTHWPWDGCAEASVLLRDGVAWLPLEQPGRQGEKRNHPSNHQVPVPRLLHMADSLGAAAIHRVAQAHGAPSDTPIGLVVALLPEGGLTSAHEALAQSKRLHDDLSLVLAWMGRCEGLMARTPVLVLP